ncbi:MAG: alpha/beta hydrolase [Deltaproteobacteria bacterium]|nr:alpha/beta hydrolase [Deltaproteobacteria bacterium]
MRRLQSEQTGISYLSSGAEDSPLVMCLHGFPDIPRTWEPLTEHLCEAGYRVVSPWLPGYAPSSLDGPFDIPSLARTILSFVDELSPSDPVRIVGHDWGSVITQYALSAPTSTQRLHGLLSTTHRVGPRRRASQLPFHRAPLAQLVTWFRSWARLLRRDQVVPASEHAGATEVLSRSDFAQNGSRDPRDPRRRSNRGPDDVSPR